MKKSRSNAVETFWRGHRKQQLLALVAFCILTDAFSFFALTYTIPFFTAFCGGFNLISNAVLGMKFIQARALRIMPCLHA